MKVVFLDVDGVLNSCAYDRERTECDGNIDKTRMVLLKTLVDSTNAKIVLSSTWRKHWGKTSEECDDKGRELSLTFREVGLEIYDKTADLSYVQRADEIKLWLEENGTPESFVILDDNIFGWGDLSEYVVRTNSRIGRGLEEIHIQKAISLLNDGKA